MLQASSTFQRCMVGKNKPKPGEWLAGRMLLKFFRAEQKKHGHDGCFCPVCERDMVMALKEFLKDGARI